MANKLPWTTPKVQTLYTTSSVGRLIAEYLDAGGQMLQMREGVLGHGKAITTRKPNAITAPMVTSG